MLILALILLLILFAFLSSKMPEYGWREWVGTISAVLTIVIIAVMIGMIIVTSYTWLNVDADYASHQEQYECLYNQAYYNIYENDNDLGKKELADQIMEWNTGLVKYRARQKNIWISFLYPMNVDDFKTIPIGLLGESVG